MSAPGALRPRPRPEIEALPRYSKAAGLEQVRWRASSNESTVAPSAAILEAVNLAASHSHLYPSLFGDTLIARLSDRLGVGDDQVLVGAGSLALLQQVLTAYTGPGTEVVYPWRSYEAYPILIGIAGASGVPVALDSEHRHDLSAMAAAVTPQTRAVLVCNPNNPTGSEFSTAEFVSFARSIPGDVLILLDEAYREFATGDVDGVDLLRAFPNIVVFRTFSKAYGLAGLRAGYAVTNSAIAADLRSAAPPFGLSAVAEAAASGKNFKGVGLELGGKDPAYVRADADLDYTVANLVDGSFFNSGQSCCAVERIYVHASIYDEFVQKFVETAKKDYKLGDPLSTETTLGPVVSLAAAKRIRKQVADAVASGAKLALAEDEFPGAKEGTTLVGPQVLVNVDHSMCLP